jgi:hypothetical protein
VRRILVLVAFLWAAPLLAQRDRVQLSVDVAGSPSSGGATVATENLLGDAKTRELLRSGFPARVH